MSSVSAVTGRAALEERIANDHGRRSCVLVGHANTGLFLALRAIAEERGTGEAIVPTITCSSVIEVIELAGFTPVFADVDVPSGTIRPESVRAKVGAQTRAIVPIHIFGHPAPVETIEHIAREHGVDVIEDGAPATGGAIEGRPIGAFGRFSLHSYGGTKIVTAGGGGALLTDDTDAAAWMRAQAARFPVLAADVRRGVLASSHRDLTHGLVDLLRAVPDANVSATYRAQLAHYGELYLHAVADGDPLIGRIAAGLDDLPANLRARREIAQRYHDGFADLGGTALELNDGWLRSGVVWRYTLLVRDAAQTQRVTRALRDARLHASNHYWSVARLFDDVRLPGSDYVSPRFLNLWVDRSVGPDDAARTIAVLRAAFDQP